MPGRTCWQTVIVNAGFELPRRSLTTFTGTPAFNRIDACVCGGRAAGCEGATTFRGEHARADHRVPRD
jgi:hypothetical protein